MQVHCRSGHCPTCYCGTLLGCAHSLPEDNAVLRDARPQRVYRVRARIESPQAQIAQKAHIGTGVNSTFGRRCRQEDNRLDGLIRNGKASRWIPYRSLEDAIKKSGI